MFFSNYFRFFVVISFILIQSLFSKEISKEGEQYTSQKLKKLFDNSFQEGIFDLYHRQMKSFLIEMDGCWKIKEEDGAHNQFLIKLNKLVSLVNDDLESIDLKRNFHENMLFLLRDLIQDKENYDGVVDDAILKGFDFINILCKWLYTSPNLLPAYIQFIKNAIPFNCEMIKEKNFIDLIDEFQASLKGNSNFNGHIAAGKPIVDPHCDGYLPSHLFTAFSIPFIISPRVTIEDKVGLEIDINPEFYNYLISLKNMGQTHFYINLMNRTGSQRSLTKAIEELSSRLENVFFVVTLNKSYDFYWQRNEYQDSVIDSEDFKNSFLVEMFDKTDEESKFKWPIQLDPVIWKENCLEILNGLHREYFNEKRAFSLQERQDFIELAYIKIIEALCQKLKPTYANISCKSSVDRAPSLLSLLFIYECIENKKRFSIEDKKRALAIFFAPPLLSHSRQSHDYRVKRLKSAVQLLEKKSRLIN